MVWNWGEALLQKYHSRIKTRNCISLYNFLDRKYLSVFSTISGLNHANTFIPSAKVATLLLLSGVHLIYLIKQLTVSWKVSLSNFKVRKWMKMMKQCGEYFSKIYPVLENLILQPCDWIVRSPIMIYDFIENAKSWSI